MKFQLPRPPCSRCPDDGPGSSEHQQANRIELPRARVRLRLALCTGLALILLQLPRPVGTPGAGALNPTDWAAAPVAVNWGSGPSPGNTFPSQNPSVSRGGALAPVAVNWGSSPARPPTVTPRG
jgi:hypothetical protein